MFQRIDFKINSPLRRSLLTLPKKYGNKLVPQRLKKFPLQCQKLVDHDHRRILLALLHKTAILRDLHNRPLLMPPLLMLQYGTMTILSSVPKPRLGDLL
jgi:hypothetical protein